MWTIGISWVSARPYGVHGGSQSVRLSLPTALQQSRSHPSSRLDIVGCRPRRREVFVRRRVWRQRVSRERLHARHWNFSWKERPSLSSGYRRPKRRFVIGRVSSASDRPTFAPVWRSAVGNIFDGPDRHIFLRHCWPDIAHPGLAGGTSRATHRPSGEFVRLVRVLNALHRRRASHKDRSSPSHCAKLGMERTTYPGRRRNPCGRGRPSPSYGRRGLQAPA